MTRRRVDRAFVALALVTLALAGGPYLAGYHAETPGLRFAGFVDNPTDSNPYVSWIRQAAAGRVMIASRYSPEPVGAHLFNLMTLLLGTLARITRITPIAAYEAGRVLAGAGLLLVLWWACGVYLPGRGMRRFAFAWLALGGGLGWWFVLRGGQAMLDPPRPLDLRVPEVSAFYSLLTFPHLAASMALMVVAPAAGWTAVPRRARPAPLSRWARSILIPSS